MSLLIGLSGLAGVGKDLLCEYLIRELSSWKIEAKRYALADELKKEANQWLVNYNIDIFKCSRDVKNVVRPFLVFHGKMKRMQSQGQHWTSILKSKIVEENPPVAIVTDIRYDEYPDDEVGWFKGHMKGELIHISTYSLNERGERLFIQAPNEDEAKNDPKMKAAASYLIEWEKREFEDEDARFNRLREHIFKFLIHLKGIRPDFACLMTQ